MLKLDQMVSVLIFSSMLNFFKNSAFNTRASPWTDAASTVLANFSVNESLAEDSNASGISLNRQISQKNNNITASSSLSEEDQSLNTSTVNKYLEDVYGVNKASSDILSKRYHYNAHNTTNFTHFKIDSYETRHCFEYGLCNLSAYHRYCYCDETCTAYNDCCVDANISASKRIPPTECLPYTAVQSARRHIGIYVVTRCPPDTNTEIAQKCEIADIMRYGPWVVDSNDYVYKNAFCTECHGVVKYKPFSVEMHNVSFHVYTQFNSISSLDFLKILYNLTNNDNVVSEMIPPKGSIVRFCALYNEPISAYKEHCSGHLYVNPVISESNLFKNPFCGPTRTKRCLGSELQSNADDYYFMHPMSVLFPLSQAVHCAEMVSLYVFYFIYE